MLVSFSPSYCCIVQKLLQFWMNCFFRYIICKKLYSIIKLYFFRLKNEKLKHRLDSTFKMSAKWVYLCGVCKKSMKATTSSITCVSCYSVPSYHLKKIWRRKKIKLSISVESDNNLIKELLINKSFENISIFSRTNKTQFHSHLLCC